MESAQAGGAELLRKADIRLAGRALKVREDEGSWDWWHVNRGRDPITGCTKRP